MNVVVQHADTSLYGFNVTYDDFLQYQLLTRLEIFFFVFFLNFFFFVFRLRANEIYTCDRRTDAVRSICDGRGFLHGNRSRFNTIYIHHTVEKKLIRTSQRRGAVYHYKEPMS